MGVSIASLHLAWDRHQDKPKHLFTLVIPDRDPQPYVSAAYFPGGWLAAEIAGIPTVLYKGTTYVPLTVVEKGQRKLCLNVWEHFKKMMGEQHDLIACPVSL